MGFLRITILKERREHDSSKAKRNHAPAVSTVGLVISERRRKITFGFTKTVNDRNLSRGTACQIVRFISQFSQESHIQILTYFYSKVTCSVSSNYYEKSRMLDFLANIFG